MVAPVQVAAARRPGVRDLGPAVRLPWGAPAAAAGAWAVLVVAELAGAQVLDHDAVLGGGTGWTSVGLFLVGWQVMVAAMMLPLAFPAIRTLACDRPGAGAFVAGAGVVWAAFGAVALGLDAVVHRTVDRVPALTARPELVVAGLLVAVGLLQLAPPANRCLAACRAWVPGPPDEVGSGARFGAGVRYGRLCVGCDSALMLLMFGVGMGSVVWMAAITLVMTVERAVVDVPIRRWLGVAALLSGLTGIAGAVL